MQHTRTLRERVAGQSAMSDVVHAQSFAPRRGRIARVFGINPLTEKAKASYSGALGELVVGDALENVGPSWDVLHDLPLHDSVLDHLLIGRPGVYSVRTANYGREDIVIDGDTLLVAGAPRDDIRCARLQGEQVASILAEVVGEPVRVRPLLVVVDPRRLTVRAPASTVRVMNSRDLVSELSGAPILLTGDEVARLSDLSDLVTTWPSADAVALDTQQLNRDFGVIRSEVRDALNRRIAWGAAATIVVYGTVCGIVATFVSMIVSR